MRSPLTDHLTPTISLRTALLHRWRCSLALLPPENNPPYTNVSFHAPRIPMDGCIYPSLPFDLCVAPTRRFHPVKPSTLRVLTLQRCYRAGGKGTPRRKQAPKPKGPGGEDPKLQAALKKLQVEPVSGIEEVNMFKEDGNVLHFAAPKGKSFRSKHSKGASPRLSNLQHCAPVAFGSAARDDSIALSLDFGRDRKDRLEGAESRGRRGGSFYTLATDSHASLKRMLLLRWFE